MKKLFLLLVLSPLMVFSQVSSWRSSSPTQSSSTYRSSELSTSTSSWRNSSPREFNRPVETRPGSNIGVVDPWFGRGWGWGWNRWDMWGAPGFGWMGWTPMWYMNDWGYRQPARVYHYSDGRRDTIRGKKPIISFGLQHTTNKQMGAFFTIGNKGYFVMDFNTTYERDRSTFFPNGTIDRVDFPLISDLEKNFNVYAGAGKRFGRVGIHAMVGYMNERVFWRGRDAVGEITFPKSTHNFMTFKIGALKDFKNFTMKMDYDPVINHGNFGLGLNF